MHYVTKYNELILPIEAQNQMPKESPQNLKNEYHDRNI